jgi:hypothetical protein
LTQLRLCLLVWRPLNLSLLGPELIDSNTVDVSVNLGLADGRNGKSAKNNGKPGENMGKASALHTSTS